MATILLSYFSPLQQVRPYKKLNFRQNPPKPRSKILSCISLDQPTPQPSTTQPQPTLTTTTSSSSLKVVFAAGGAGAQVFSAVAIADEIKITTPDASILFIGTDTGMESKAVPSAGYKFKAIPATPLPRLVLSLANLSILVKWAMSMAESWKIMKEFNPQVVVGTGGYVSFPICLIAALNGLKVVIQEQRSVPGLANWVLSFISDVVFVAYNSSIDAFPCDKKKIVVSRNPVRLALRKYMSEEVPKAFFFRNLEKGVDKDVIVVLVLGGSFGANSMNNALFDVYNLMLNERPNLHIIWETGVKLYDEMESRVTKHPRLYLSPCGSCCFNSGRLDLF